MSQEGRICPFSTSSVRWVSIPAITPSVSIIPSPYFPQPQDMDQVPTGPSVMLFLL